MFMCSQSKKIVMVTTQQPKSNPAAGLVWINVLAWLTVDLGLSPNSTTYLYLCWSTFAQCCSKEVSLESWNNEKARKQLKRQTNPPPRASSAQKPIVCPSLLPRTDFEVVYPDGVEYRQQLLYIEQVSKSI